jgi:hypothetical protein
VLDFIWQFEQLHMVRDIFFAFADFSGKFAYSTPAKVNDISPKGLGLFYWIH